MSDEGSCEHSNTRDPEVWGREVEGNLNELVTDYRDDTLEVLKVRAYRSLHHWVHLLGTVGDEHPTPALSCVLTGLMFLFPCMLMNNIICVLPAPSPTASVKVKSRIVQMAFSAACHLVKPVTSENKPYLIKRWNAAVASIVGGLNHMTGFVSSDRTETVFGSECEGLHNHVSAKMIAEQLLQDPPDRYPVICKAVRNQLSLVYRRSRMVAIEYMHSYCENPTNAAITLRPVWTQVVSFLSRYKEAKKKVEDLYPGGWLFARSLCEDLLLPLEASKYPHLYYTAISTAKRNGQLDANKFITSERANGCDRVSIDKLIRVRVVSGQSAGSEDFKEAMSKLGINVDASQAASRTKKRPRRRSSSED